MLRAAENVLRAVVLACGALWFVGAATYTLTVDNDAVSSSALPRYTKWRNAIDRASNEFLAQAISFPIKGVGIAATALLSFDKDNIIVRIGDAVEARIDALFPGDEAREEEVLSKLAVSCGRLASFVVGCVLMMNAARWDSRITKGPILVGIALFVLASALEYGAVR